MIKLAVIGGDFIDGTLLFKKPAPYDIPIEERKSFIQGLTGKIKKQEVIYYQRNSESPAEIEIIFKALKDDGVKHIVSITTCGSLQEEICPGEYVVFNQLIDFTDNSRSKLIKHMIKSGKVDISMANPYSDDLRYLFIEAAIINGLTIHNKGTLVALSGPRATTRAESNLYRQWGADVVEEHTTREATISRLLKMEYAAIGLCTDFDTWRTDIPPAGKSDINEVIENQEETAIELLKKAIVLFPDM